MLKNIKQLYGRKIAATDGDLGQVKDFYFDDRSWSVRYVIVDTGNWIPGRQVLLPPLVFGPEVFAKAESEPRILRVDLTRKQIEESPSIDSQLPVSRQYEEDYHRYYGWPTYWQEGGVWGGVGVPLILPPSSAVPPPTQDRQAPADTHLRSMKAITGYRVEATDGAVGSVQSFMIDSKRWGIRELVIEAGHWFSGKTVFLLPENINRISYEDSTVFVNLSKDDFKHTLRDDVAQAGAGRP